MRGRSDLRTRTRFVPELRVRRPLELGANRMCFRRRRRRTTAARPAGARSGQGEMGSAGWLPRGGGASARGSPTRTARGDGPPRRATRFRRRLDRPLRAGRRRAGYAQPVLDGRRRRRPAPTRRRRLGAGVVPSRPAPRGRRSGVPQRRGSHTGVAAATLNRPRTPRSWPPRRGYAATPSPRARSIALFGCAPMTAAVGSPSLNKITVGIDITP
jgi:hypothetical protein